MLITIVATLLAAAPPLALAQDTELRRETWPDGTPRIERSVRVTPHGEVEHGRYVRFHEDGRPAVEGANTDGVPDGPWTTYWPDGSIRTRGDFLDGRRAGKWESYHPNGQLASTGRYRLGMRDRKWVYMTAEGVKLEDESGLYRTAMQLYESRNRKLLAEVRDGRLHGRFVSWWDSGKVQLEGHYRDGVRAGWWSLWHLDGSYEPDLFSGFYMDGERVEAAAIELDDDPFQIPEETAAGLPPEPDPARLPRLARLPWVKPSQRGAFAEKIHRFLDHSEELQRRLTEQLLLQYGRDAVPEVLNRLAELDLGDPDDRSRAGRLVGLLHGVCKGRGFALTGEAEGDRLSIVRWFTWFELARLQDDWWNDLRNNALPPQLLTAGLVDGLARPDSIVAEEREAGDEAQGVIDTEIKPKLSMLFRRRQRETRPREIRKPLERGLSWLARHQAVDGSWDCDGFEIECERRGLTVCDGPGLQPHDVGSTSLALLAFLGDGNTTHAGDHREAVMRGVRWLLSQQDPETGLIGGAQGHAVTYNHALATLVLCEVASFTDSPAVRVPARRAVDLILSAQNPGSGWHYALEPDGHNDTSVTGWMLQALHAAREAELPIESGAFDGALAWIERATDPEVGRVGYDAPGNSSSRVHQINDHFPVDSGEAMTAVGLFSRFLLGQDPDDFAIMERQADLLLRALPRWAPEEYGCDFYYWSYGTDAMGQMGGAYWKAWRAALWRALLGSQREDEDGTCRGGSWDPVGPWGYAGGRVYATALGVLCLEGEFRHPPLAH